MTRQNEGLHEKCGVFACIGCEDAALQTYNGLHALQHRGQQGGGIVTFTSNHQLRLHKGHGLISDIFSSTSIAHLKGSSAIGHNRYATTGADQFRNIQPFSFQHREHSFALAHNGNISNSLDLRRNLEKQGSVFHASSDSELFGHYLARSELHKNTIFDSLLKFLDQFEGAFSLVLIDKKGIYGARDKWGFRPLVLGKKRSGFFLSSESCGLDIVGAEFIRDIKPGEVIHIDHNGNINSSFYTKDIPEQQLCAMELIYFSRPDSVVDGINVHEFRKETGKELARTSLIPDADMVVPVPDSSISSALGYAEEANIPFELGIIRNRYIARTFITATQKARIKGVKAKLNVNRKVVNGKKVVLIDDSIVRGTTITQIIALLRNAGAKEVHVRVASPKIIAPSYYGINISTYKELLATGKSSDKEICKTIGADSLAYLSVGSLSKIANPVTLDLCIFTNKYRTKISKKTLREAKIGLESTR